MCMDRQSHRGTLEDTRSQNPNAHKATIITKSNRKR